jgi:TonB family protein
MRIGERRLLAKREQRWSRSFNANHPVVKQLEQEDAPENRRAVRLGIAIGAVLHVVLFLITFPEVKHKIYQVGTGTRVYEVKQFRFQPPKPQVKRRAPTRPKTKTIPIPDPTPDDPEPIFHDEVDTPPVDFPDAELEGVLAIPDGPPGPSKGVLPIAGNVRAPERVYSPDPVYPEEARLARVQGVVILQTIIDTLGKVADVRVLKGLPSGLTEAAVEAVSAWKFNPATLEGKPVAVYYMVTITFSVQ